MVDIGSEQELPVGELVGIGIAIILLWVLFRSKVAMLVTLLGALLGVFLGQMLLAALSKPLGLPSFAAFIATMLGLGAGIDYALLIVGRYREQVAQGDSPRDAAAKSAATSGASVVAAGLIVMLAIAGLLVIGIPFIGKLGVGAAIAVGGVVLSALTVLMALIGAFKKWLTPKDPNSVKPSAAFERWGDAGHRAAVALDRPAGPTAGEGGIGDFAAFAVIASRFALSIQQATGFKLDDQAAGQRTACLTGAWAGETQQARRQAEALTGAATWTRPWRSCWPGRQPHRRRRQRHRGAVRLRPRRSLRRRLLRRLRPLHNRLLLTPAATKADSQTGRHPGLKPGARRTAPRVQPSEPASPTLPTRESNAPGALDSPVRGVELAVQERWTRGTGVLDWRMGVLDSPDGSVGLAGLGLGG